MAVLITIPSSNRNPGVVGPTPGVSLPPGTLSWRVRFTQAGTWPASGDVVKIIIEESKDDGASYQFSASLTLGGGPWKDRHGNATLENSWDTSVMYPGGLIRVTANILQQCRLGATVETL